LQVLVITALLGGAFQASGLFSSYLGDGALGRIGDFFGRLLPKLQAEQLFADRATPGSLAFWYYDLNLWLKLLAETVQIAIVATLLGAAMALPLSFLAARNFTPAVWVYWGVRRSLELVRTLPDLIMALILVAAFGLGPTPGVIALTVGTAASLTKLFAEANEAADMHQLETLQSAGGNWWQQLRFGLLPQVLPTLASYSLLRLEINVGGAAALGIVGAGGIGVELSRAITFMEFDTYFAVLLLIVGLIFVLDLTSEAIRSRLIGLEQAT
jgi:phosphonate transport system permease protein